MNTDDMLHEIVLFLNHLNRQYAEGSADYDWNGYHDNCVHTVHNALAAASMWEPLSVDAVKVRQAANLAIPANAFLKLAARTTGFPLEDVEAVASDPAAHDSLLEFAWLPARPGSLVTALDVHTPNELYDTTFRLYVLEGPGNYREVRRMERVLDSPRHTRTRENLLWYQTRYREILAARPPDAGSLLKGDPLRIVKRRDYRYAKAQLREVEAALQALGGSGAD